MGLPRRLGGAPGLDFVNTLDPRDGDASVEHLVDYPTLAGWACVGDLLPSAVAEALVTQAAREPGLAEAALRDALLVREALYDVFIGLVHDRTPDPSSLATVNRSLAQAAAHLVLAADAEGYTTTWSWDAPDAALSQPLWPVLQSAVDLLNSPAARERIGECAATRGCGWLFLDTSKGGRRRWCSMDSCGARAKARRHYQRVTKGRP